MKLKLLLLILIGSFAVSCSGSKAEVSQSKIEKLNSQIKTGQYEEIYKDSSQSLQSIISEKVFVIRMKKAVEKMKETDDSLNFQKSTLTDILSQVLNSESWTSNFQKLERNDKKLEFLTQWTKRDEENSFKLRSIVIVEPTETGKHNIYYIEEDKTVTD